MQASPDYAVLVVSHNHAATLGACLRAVQALEPPPIEVVVVDNASTDGSAELAAAHGVAVIRETSNTGFAAAANRAINHTTAPWVLLLNPDCAPRPDFAALLLDAAAGSAVGSATGKLLRADNNNLEPTSVLDAAGMVLTSSGRHFDRGSGELDHGLYDTPARVFGGTGAATLYSREALVDVAYENGEVFAETFFAYREDAELAWRLQLRGWSCSYQPRAVAAHRRGFRPEQGRGGHRSINRHSVRNRFLLRLHCADFAWHLRALPFWLLRDLMVVVACFTVEPASARALAELWQLRHDALERRRWVLGRRTVSARQMHNWFRKTTQVEEIEAR